MVAAALIVCAMVVKRGGTAEAKRLDAVYLHQMAVCGFSFVISNVYLILLSAMVNPQYIMGTSMKLIWCFCALTVSMAYLLRRCPKTAALLPLLLCIVVSVTVTDGDVYMIIVLLLTMFRR